jgi:hypothetical protein
MSSVDLLQQQVTQAEALAALKSAILSAPSPPEEVTLDTLGTPENAFLWCLSLAEEGRSEDRARYAQAGFRSTAPLEYLRLIAAENFGLTVQTAGFATTFIAWQNTSGNAYGPFDPGELRVVNDGTKALYENTEVVSITPAQLSPFVQSTGVFSVRAVESGTSSNAQIDEIDRLETTLEGVTITNNAAALTNDDESRESINRRIDARIGLFGVAGVGGMSSGGPATAVESVALSGRDNGGGCLRTDGTRVQVTRTKLLRDDATGISTLYVAGDAGPIDPADLTFVEDEVVWYAERVCSQVEVENTTNNTIAPVAAITIRQTSLTNAEIVALVNSALPSAALGVPIGGFDVTPSPACTKEYVEGAIRGALIGSVVLVNIVLSSPAADVVMAADEIVQFTALTLGTLTITRIA